MSTEWEQALVNAQVDVNRAVFLMNARGNRKQRPYNMMSDEDISGRKILKEIDLAIKDLQETREGYMKGKA